MEHKNIESGLNLHLLRTRKFKTGVVTILLRSNLKKETVTKNALLARALGNGCEKFPKKADISKECEEMFGAHLEIGIVKKGEEQIIQLYMELMEQELDRAGELINSLLFQSKIILEKKQLKEIINGRINDKKSYALDRCIEEMCKNEDFGIYADGYLQDIEALNEENMKAYYESFMSECTIEAALIGSFSLEESENWARKYLGRKNTNIKKIQPATIIPKAVLFNEVREDMKVSQGKLVIGLRCDFDCKGMDFYKLLLFNAIMGGGSSSKLFKKLREEHSLCYYISSFIYRAKVIMIVQAGIEEKNYEKTVNLIKTEITNSTISGKELSLAKYALKSQFETLKDSPQGIMDFYMSNTLVGDDTNISQMPEIIDRFDAGSLNDCAERITLDTSFFLL